MKLRIIVLTVVFFSLIVTLSAQINDKTPRLRVAASGGIGYLIANGEDAIDGVVDQSVVNKLNNDLRWATNLNGDIHYLFDGGWGLGVKYLFQQTSAEANDVVIDIYDMYHYVVMDMWEKDYVNFIGPSLFGYTALGNNNLYLTSSLSAGYAWLRSEASVLNNNVLATSDNFGMNAELGIDYLLTPNFGIGVNLGYLMTSFSKVKITDGTSTQEQTLDKESRYNASNIHLSVGLRYYLTNKP